jgi:ATPase family associated with various cellular activities (AAA)
MTEAAIDGLTGALERLDRMLSRAVERIAQVTGDQAAGDPFRGLYITAQEASHMAARGRWSPILGVIDDEPPVTAVLDPSSRLAALAYDFGLGAFDIDVLTIALAPEIDLGYGRLYAFLQDDVSRRRPSVDLALNLLCATVQAKTARREHFAADAPLIAGDLVTLGGDPVRPAESSLAQALEVDGGVARHLLGIGGPDPRLRLDATVVEAPPDTDAPPAPAAAAFELEPLVTEAHASRAPLRLCFSGPAVGLKRATAEWLAARAGAPLSCICLTGLLGAPDGLRRAARRVLHEARLRHAIVLLEDLDALDPSDVRALSDALAGHRGVAILAGPDAQPLRGQGLLGLLDVGFPVPEHDHRQACWREALARRGAAIAEDDLYALAGRFLLTPDQIADAVEAAGNAAQCRGPGAEPSVDELYAAARYRSDASLAGVARKIRPSHTWDQLALPEETEDLLRDMCRQVEERHRVLDEWGFRRRFSLGTGVNALFTGPSGTGKTTAADIMGNALGLDVYKVDLSGVVSKFIGETEKNLDRIFRAAENSNAILLFDEADALFGKRSEVRDSHDRYANIEIAYLLQQMEQYEGVAILATNLRQNMDEAFVRRLQFVVEFPFPDEEQRARIWPLLFPDEAERDPDIDFELLARQFRITGGSIKNIVLGAAFLAAGEREAIGLPHLLRALRREYQKMGKVLTAAELEPFEELVAA